MTLILVSVSLACRLLPIKLEFYISHLIIIADRHTPESELTTFLPVGPIGRLE